MSVAEAQALLFAAGIVSVGMIVHGMYLIWKVVRKRGG